MGVEVVQLTSKSHHANILASLHQLRLQGHFSDVTVQVDSHGDVQEFQAHQVMLAAASGHFRNILLSQHTGQEKLLLSDVRPSHFAKFVEFVYTGKVEVDRNEIDEVQAAAQLLDCKDLSEVCGEAVSAGMSQKAAKKKCATNAEDDLEPQDGKNEKLAKRMKQPESPDCQPQSSGKEGVSTRFRAKSTVKNDKPKGRVVKRRTLSRKALQRHLNPDGDECSNEKQVASDAADENEERTEVEAQSEDQADKDDEASVEMQVEDADWELQGEKDQAEEEDEEDEDEESKERSKRTSKAQFHCNKCQRTFHYERSYLKHISTYHGVKADVVYRCETCLQTFANRSNLKIHEKHVHSSERLFACDSCAKTFKRKKDVVRHQKQVHDRNNLRHVCTTCGKSLSSKTALLLHERIHTGTKPFECSDCGARFTQNAALKMHRRTHTGEKPFACDECDARFTQKHMLSYHKRSHTGEKPFMCEACGKSFASKEYLRHHSNIHTGSRPYKCEQCGRGFAQRNSLHQHLKTHTGERPYRCLDCGKQFTQINALQRHQRIHTGEKPFMCGLCNRTFTDMSTLRRHTMIHDADAPWKTYLVVLEGNVEDKKTKTPAKGKAEKAGAEEKKGSGRKSGGGAATGAADTSNGVSAADTPAAADAAGTASTESMVLPAEPVTLPSDWTSHGTIALVSHGTLGGITVIHTEMPPGTQIQPIMTADSAGTSVISLDSSAVPVPFSIPVSMAHSISLPSEASSASLSVPSVLSVPVSDCEMAAVTEIPTVSTSSVLEAAASQTILAPVSEAKITSEMVIVQPDIQTVIIADKICGKEETEVVLSDGQQRAAGNSLDEIKKTLDGVDV